MPWGHVHQPRAGLSTPEIKMRRKQEKRGKSLICYDYQNVNSLHSGHYYFKAGYRSYGDAALTTCNLIEWFLKAFNLSELESTYYLSDF